MFDKPGRYRKERKEGGGGGKERGYSRGGGGGGMDPRYWKEFESLGEKVAGSEEPSPPRRYRRGNTRSRSSSSSSSGSSSSSSSSRRHSDSRRGYRKRQHVRSNSPSRTSVRSQSYGREPPEGTWFPPPHQQPPYPPQQDLPPSSSFPIPNQFPPPQVQGQYPGNFPGPNFGPNYRPFGNYEPPPPNYYPPNFPPHSGSQPPPPHNFPLGGGPGPGQGVPPGNWEMFPDQMLPPPNIIQGPGERLSGPPHGMSDVDKKAEEAAKKEAIEQELLQQKRTLSKQREDYVRRKFSLNRELSRLKDQKRDLHKEKSKENERILRENAKLQGEIQQKLKSIDNVIEMLTNVIGDGSRLPDIIKEIKQMEKEKKEESQENQKRVKKSDKKKSGERSESSRRRSSSPEAAAEVIAQKKNILFYDPGLHWCPDCNIFPKTVSEYLQHLHTPQHSENGKMKLEEYPWHNSANQEKSPTHNKDLPTKRIPIRGVQFLVPATAWFCSMCKVWLGDDHCATKHVQSNQHSQHYSEFIAKNPHWEVDWLTERTRSYEKKSEAKQQAAETISVPAPSSTSVTLDSLSNQLLAMIAKTQETPAPPPPPPITKESSSSSEDDDSPDTTSKKKKKKPKKKKSKDERRSPSKEKVTQANQADQIKLSYKSMPGRVDPIPVDDNFISEWMPRVEKRELVLLKKKSKDDIESKTQKKHKSSSREVSTDREKKPDLYDQVYNDHDDAIIFDKQVHQPEKDSRNRRKYDDEPKYERHSRYERSPKEKYKYKGSEKINKSEKDDKNDDYKKKFLDKKHQKDMERERLKKSPFSRIRESIEKKKLKNKAEKTSDEDIHETAFEKRSSESAAKKKDGKKLVINTLPKTKLPFIGRMPILKKKVEQKSEDKDGGKKDNEEDVTKDVPEVPPTEPSALEAGTGVSIEELPKSTLIISKRPRLAEPGVVKKEILFSKPANDNLTEQDMELDEEQQGVVKEEEPAKDELHKDFKDALDLLFPEEKKKEDNDDTVEGREEVEIKAEEQPPAAYIVPQGYDVSLYPPYYEQQGYIQQPWPALAGYEQPAQYPPGPYAFPPPVIEQAPPQPVPKPPEATPEPKKKKNPPSQRMRRHLMKKKAKEAAGKEENADDDEEDKDGGENGEDSKLSSAKSEAQKPMGEMSDLAMLGIDEDDAAAMGLY